MIFNYFQYLFLDESTRKTLDILEESNFENKLEVMVDRRELDNLQEDISDDVIRPYVTQYVRNLMENLRNMSARAQYYEDVQVNQDDSFVSDRDYDEYTTNDPDEEQDNLDDEVEDDEDEEDQEGEEDEGPHFIVILVDVSIPVGLYTTFLLYTPKINVLKQPFKEIKNKKKLFNVRLNFSNPIIFIFVGISHTRM